MLSERTQRDSHLKRIQIFRLAAVSVTKFLIGQGQATTLVALCSTAKGGLNPYLAVSRFLLVKATNIIQSSETQPQMG